MFLFDAGPVPILGAPLGPADAVLCDTRAGGVADWPRVRTWLAPRPWLATVTGPATLPEFAGRIRHAGFVVADTLLHTWGPLVVLARSPGRGRPLFVDAARTRATGGVRTDSTAGRYPPNVLAAGPGEITGAPVVLPEYLYRWLVRLLTAPGALVVDPLGTVPGVTLDALHVGRQGAVCVSPSRQPAALGRMLLELSGRPRSNL